MQAIRNSGSSTTRCPCTGPVLSSLISPRRRQSQHRAPPIGRDRLAPSAALPSPDTVSAISQVLTSTAVALGAWYLLDNKASTFLEQDKIDRMRSEPCPRCDGRGYERCVCSRWSDGDESGCSSCAKTGYMRCRSCGGGGTAVPLLATVPKHSPSGQRRS